MIHELLKPFKVHKSKYIDALYTFEVEVTGDAFEGSRIQLLNKINFPDSVFLKFIDERVQIHDEVMIWLKEEVLLRSEGWKEISKHSIKSAASPFRIGKEKKKFLGGSHKGKIGIDKNFHPFVFFESGYRFSPDEVKCVIKTDDLFKGPGVSLETSDGTLTYSPELKWITLPNGTKLTNQMINNLIVLMKRAKIL